MTHAQQQQHVLWTDRYLKFRMMEAQGFVNLSWLMPYSDVNLLLAMLLKGQRLKLFYKVHPVSHEPPSLPGVGCVTLADLSHFH